MSPVGERSISELQRYTTAYVEREDRIRPSGEIIPGDAEVLWLTRRLIGRLVPHLCAWLERWVGAAVGLVGDGAADGKLRFDLQVARQWLASQPRVLPEGPQRSWRVQAVDMSVGANVLHLVFRGAADERVRLTLQVQVLRQWLGILHAQCARGEWSLEVWPSWLSALLAAGARRAITLHCGGSSCCRYTMG